ncbi:MAG: hypothetical protein QOF21_2299, partial [Actinomycetota bacterium]
MEQQIPTSLANAPRDALGRPVPYIILWESEEPYLDTDPALSKFGWPGLAVCRTTRVGDGAPLFKSLNESRQRHAALHWLCVMCGRPATPDGNVSPASPLWAVRLVGPDERPLSHASPASQGPLARLRDSWACIGCLHYALRACPALVGLRHEPGSRVQVLRITAASIELGIKRPESDESDERDESRPVCSIAHIAVWEAEEFRSETFVAWLDHTLSEGDRTVNLEEVDDGQLWTVSPDLQVGWDHGHLTVQGTSGETRVLSSEFVPLL